MIKSLLSDILGARTRKRIVLPGSQLDEKTAEREKRLALKERIEQLKRQVADFKAQIEKHKPALAKAAVERDARLKLKDQVIALKARLAELESENRILQRKYNEARVGEGADAASGTDWERLSGIAAAEIDDAEIRGRIAAYHETFEKKAYNRVWAERVQAILNVLETGERDLSRALAKVRRHEERTRAMGLDSRRWVINDRYMDLPWRPAAAAYRSAVFEAVLDQVRADTTKIIETGSGWGEHLCNIFLEGGPNDATYYALEMEEEGRKCSLLLAALEARLKFEAHFFDYRFPDYSMLPRDDGHTILLTAHSVEQVGEIHPNCILSALELGRRVTGVHFEPVGWQTRPESEWTEITAEHHARCMDKDYNRNIWALLNRLQDEGHISIRDMRTNFIGLDYNPATYILWEKA